MNLIINTTILKKGGGFQVAHSFINECINFPDNTYHVFLSEEMSMQIVKSDFSNNFHFYQIKHSPSSILYSIITILKLKKLENKIKPDCVFTVFGPSYWTPKFPHLLGYAQGYYLFPESDFFKRIRSFSKIKISFLKIVHRFFFRKNSDFYYVESEDAKKRLSFFLMKPQENIFVFSNTHHSVFNLPLNGNPLLRPKFVDEIRLITISAFYEHKNLEIIKKTIFFLNQKSSKKYSFILTIDQKIFEKIFSDVKDNVINLGNIPLDLCPKAYQESDFVFLPTLIEIFTASYPEAMKMKKPILTSDLSFAHSICGDAAEYFNPIDPEDIANKIISLTDNLIRQTELIRNSEKQLQKFETSKSRAEKLLNICQQIAE